MMDSYIETFEKAIENHKNGNDDKSVPNPFLVHRTSFQPKRTENGYDVGSTFYERGGINQKVTDQDLSPLNSMNVHFAVQGAVTDHTFGSWTDRKYTLYAPYIPALAENGLPETCLTADTAFVSTDKPVHLPGGILIEDTPAEQLGSDFTRTSHEGHMLMADRITPENRDSALSHIKSMRKAFGNHSTLAPIENDIRSGKSDSESMSSIRDIVGANALNSVPEFYFSSKNIHGFLSMEDNRDFAEMLSSRFPDPSGFRTTESLHNANAGHELRHPDSKNKVELEGIANDEKNHPKLRDIAEKLSTSDFHRELRGGGILEVLRNNDMHIPLRENGTPHFCSFLAGSIERNHEVAKHYGAISEGEATNIFSHHLTPDERQKVIDYAANVKHFPDGKLWEKLNNLDQSAHLQENHDRAKAFEQTLRNGTDEKAALPVQKSSTYVSHATPDERQKAIDFAANTKVFPDGKLWEKLNNLDQSAHLQENHDRAKAFEQTLRNGTDEKAALPVQKSSTYEGIPMSTQQTAMPHTDDAIHVQLIKNNNKFDAFAASMDAFNNQPAIREAHDRAAKYGIDPKASIHEALDNHPNLKASYLNLHKNFHEHIQPAMEKHMELIGQMQDPDMKNRAMKSVKGRMEHMADAQKNWPDRDNVMKTTAENKQGRPGLGDIIARFLARLKEIITGKPAAVETAKQTSDHSGTAQKVGDVALAVVAPEVAVAKTVAQSVGQNAQNPQNGTAQRPGLRRK